MNRTAAINKLEEGLTELFEKGYRDIPVYIESKLRWEENLETECVVADREKLKNGEFRIRFWGKGEDTYFTLDDIAKDKSITKIFYPKFLYNEYVKLVFGEEGNLTMKILKHGMYYNDPNKPIMFNCGTCGCEFEAETNEYFIYKGSSYAVAKTKCPECGSDAKYYI